MHYIPKGVCSRQIDFEVEDNIVKNVKFHGGCPGNSIGVASLVEGMNIDDAINRLSGILCGVKSTACPDQLAKALAQYKAQENHS